MLLAYRTAKGGLTANGKAGVLGRSSLSDWDLFFLGAASKLVATGGTYPYVSSSVCTCKSADILDRRQISTGKLAVPHTSETKLTVTASRYSQVPVVIEGRSSHSSDRGCFW